MATEQRIAPVDDPRFVEVTNWKAVREAFGSRDGVTTDELDGLTVELGDGSWFNLRPSNTEPLLRLNLEAATRDECDAHVAELLALVTSV